MAQVKDTAGKEVERGHAAASSSSSSSSSSNSSSSVSRAPSRDSSAFGSAAADRAAAASRPRVSPSSRAVSSSLSSRADSSAFAAMAKDRVVGVNRLTGKTQSVKGGGLIYRDMDGSLRYVSAGQTAREVKAQEASNFETATREIMRGNKTAEQNATDTQLEAANKNLELLNSKKKNIIFSFEDGKYVERDAADATGQRILFEAGENGERKATDIDWAKKENERSFYKNIAQVEDYLASDTHNAKDTILNKGIVMELQRAAANGTLGFDSVSLQDGSTESVSNILDNYLAHLEDIENTNTENIDRGNIFNYINGAITSNSSTSKQTELYTTMANRYLENAKTDEDKAYWQETISALSGVREQDYVNDTNVQRNQLREQIEHQQARIDRILQFSKAPSEVVDYWNPNVEYNDEYYAAKAKSASISAQYNAAEKRLEALNAEKEALEQAYFDHFATDEVNEAIRILSLDPATQSVELSKIAINRNKGVPIENWVTPKQIKEELQATADDFRYGIGLDPKFYNTWDREKASIASAGKGIRGAFQGTAGTIVEGASSFFSGAKPIEKEAIEQTREKRIAYDNIHGAGAFAYEYGNGKKIEEAQSRLLEIRKAVEDYDRMVGVDDVPDAEIAAKVEAYDKERKELEKQIRAWRKEDFDYGYSDHEMAERMYAIADTFDSESQRILTKALEDSGKYEKYLILGTKTAVEMGFDMGVGALTGTSTLVPMFTRVFGSAASEARRAGASLEQMYGYALTGAAIETITEKVFGTFSKIGYGKGMASELSERLVQSLAESSVGRTFLRVCLAGAEEGSEEALADILNYISQNMFEGDLKNLKADALNDIATDTILGAMMGVVGAGAGIVTGQNAAANAQLRSLDTAKVYSDLLNDTKKLDQLKTQKAEEAKKIAAPKGSTAFNVINAGAEQSTSQNQRINHMVNNAAELRNFERQTGQKVEGTTTQEKRESVYRILAEYETEQSRPVEIDDPSLATKVMERIAGWPDKGPIPDGEKLTAEEFSIAKKAGWAEESDRGRMTLQGPGMTRETAAKLEPQISANRTSGMEGYVQRFSESPFMQKIRESTQNLLSRKNQAKEEAQPIDTADIIEEGEAKSKPKYDEPGFVNPMGEDVADDSGKVDASKVQVDSMGEIVGPEKAKTDEAPTAPETAQGEEQASTKAETPEATAASVKPKGNERQSDLGSKAARQKQREQNRRSHAQLQQENRQRQEADNAAINKAYDNKESGKESKVSFEGTFEGKPATITYDAGNSTLTFTREDGTSETLRDVGKRTAKKLVNKARSTLNTSEAQPSKASFVVEEANEEVDALEASGPDERIVSAIRSAKDIGELERLYGSDPDAFAAAYEAVAGKPLSHGNKTADEIAELYDTLHPSEEAEPVADEAEGEEETPAPTESEEEAPAEPAEEIAESEKESEPVEAEEPVEAAEAEEEAPELPEGPLKDRLHAGQVSDTEVTTRLSNPATRKELKAELGLPRNASEAVVRNAVKIAALNHDQVMDDLQNGRFVAANIQALVRTGKVTAEELSGVLRDAGIIGKKNVTGLPTLEKRYIQLQAKVNPDALTDADRAKLATQTKHDASTAATNEQRKAEASVSIEEQLKGDKGNGSENAGDAAGRAVVSGYVQRQDAVGVPDTGTAGSANGRSVGTLLEPLTGRKYDAAEQSLNAEYERRGISGPRKADLETIRNDGVEARSKKNIYILASNKVSKPYKALLKIANEYGRKFMTVMTAEDATDVGESGFCHRSTDIFGPTFITHRYIPKNLRSYTNLDGQSVIHEYDHDFGTVYAQEHNGERPDYLEGLKSITGDLAEAGLIDADKQANIRNLLLRIYAQKVGPNAIERLVAAKYKNQVNRIEKCKAVLGDYRAMNGKEKLAYFKENFPDNYKAFTTKAREEIMMELSSEGAYFTVALKASGYDIRDFSIAARAWLERDGGVPAGFHEKIASIVDQLNKDNLAWLEEQDKIRDSATRVSGTTTGTDDTVSELTDLAPEMQELQALNREPAAEPPAYQPIDPEDIEEFYVQPNSEDNGVRTNTPISERITSQERAKAGEVTYQKTSLKTIGQAAHESIEQILDHPEFGFDKLTEHLLNKNPAAINTLEQQMINELYARVQTQRHNLLHVKNAPVDSRISSDVKELWRLERQLRDRSSESAGEAARKVTQQRFAMTPEQEVLNNFSHTFIGDADPTTPDTDSIGAQMYSIGATTVAGITDIDARRKSGELDEKQAVSEMLAMVREINKVRDVAKTFGPAGAIMSKWEQACLDRIAEKGGEDAYDTLRLIALGSVNRICSDFESVGAVNTLKQVRYLNLLSNPATTLSNLLNNFESSFSGAVGQTVGNKLAGKRAQNIMGGDVPLTGNVNWHRGLIGKTNKALNEYMLTKGAESVLSLYYGLDVDEGVVDIDLGAKHNQNGNAMSRLLATFQFISGLNMSTTDAMAIARAYKGMEMEIDKMDISEARKAEMKADAMYEARRQMYHEDSKAAKAMENVRDFMNGVTLLSSESGKIGLGDVVMPFVQVPTNVAVRAMKASPVGVLYGLGKYAQGMRKLEAKRNTFNKVQDLIKRKEAGVALTLEEYKYLRENQNVAAPTDAEVRRLVRTLGESCTNGTATVFAVIAAMAGGLVDFDDEDDEELKRLAKERGFTGLQLNLSNILRFGRGGWKKDDIVIGGSWLQVLAIPMVAGHQIFKSWVDEDRSAGSLVESIIKSPFTTFKTFVDAAQEIPGVRQMVDIWDAYENVQQYGDFEQQKNKVVAGLSQYAANAASTFVIPNAVAQFAAGVDNTVRDVYRADTNMQIAANIWKNKLPWLRKTIPELKTSLGNTRTYGSNKAMGILNRMVIPGTGVQKWVPTALEEEYRKIAADGGKIASIVPAASAPKTIKSLNGAEYTLNAEEARYIDETYTENVVRLQYALMNQPEYQELTNDQKIAAMNKLRQFEDHVIKTDFLLSRGDQSGVQMDNWEEMYLKADGVDASISSIEGAAQYAYAYAAATEIYSTKTRKFTGSEKTEWFLDNVYDKLNDEQRAAFDGSFPNMDKLYDGYKSVGLTAEEFEDIRATVRKYDDLISNKPDDVSETAYQRNMMKEWERKYSGKKLDWVVENNRIWRNRPVSSETIDKFTKVGLSISEADGWLDRKDNLVPPDDYKTPPMNQVIQSLASYGEMSDKTKWITLMTDGDVTESARNNLGKYKLEHPDATLQEAIDNVSYWYKDAYSKKSKWEERFYSFVYSNPNANRNKEYPFADELAKRLGLSA